MTHERLSYLLHLYSAKRLTEAEKDELQHFLDGLGEGSLPEHLISPLLAEGSSGRADYLSEAAAQDVLQSVFALDTPPVASPEPVTVAPPAHRVHFRKRWWWAAAILIIGTTTAIVVSSDRQSSTNTYLTKKNATSDIQPGSNKALLTLSDGTTITLDSAANGVLAQQGNSSVIKLANGEVRYDAKGIAQSEVMLNTMTTPRGGQYQLTLPDGSKVWLNAASSISYPAFFTGKDRKVKVTGEVYLEVAHNKARPFVVDIDGKSTVQVLGTSFNINSYGDGGDIRTTLIDGSVKVGKIPGQARNDKSQAVILQPGQQAVIPDLDPGPITVQPANIEQVLAWKNGYFNFDNTTIQKMAMQIERWYDIKVVFEGKSVNMELNGKMDRGVQLSDITQFFKVFGFDTKLEGRTLILKEK
jgi:ferric-dicitrate binding protein FerR (iron transport regulator)